MYILTVFNWQMEQLLYPVAVLLVTDTPSKARPRGSVRAQEEEASMISPPALVASPHQVWLLTPFLTNRTEPSRKSVFTLPEMVRSLLTPFGPSRLDGRLVAGRQAVAPKPES